MIREFLMCAFTPHVKPTVIHISPTGGGGEAKAIHLCPYRGRSDGSQLAERAGTSLGRRAGASTWSPTLMSTPAHARNVIIEVPP